MAESKNTQPDATKQVGTGGGLNLKPKAKGEETIEAPLEFSSVNKGIHIVKDGKEVTIMFDELVAQEIGSYRKANVGVKFTEGGALQFIINAKA